MKISRAIVIASVIFLIGIIFYSLSNRYYIDTSTKLVVDRLTGKVTHPVAPTPVPTPAPQQTAFVVKPDKGDFSKVVISREATNVNQFMYEITCTVQNNDSVTHGLTVKAVFYDKNKKPILTEESNRLVVDSSDIESVTIAVFNSVENISSYELKLIQSKIDGILN